MSNSDEGSSNSLPHDSIAMTDIEMEDSSSSNITIPTSRPSPKTASIIAPTLTGLQEVIGEPSFTGELSDQDLAQYKEEIASAIGDAMSDGGSLFGDHDMDEEEEYEIDLGDDFTSDEEEESASGDIEMETEIEREGDRKSGPYGAGPSSGPVVRGRQGSGNNASPNRNRSQSSSERSRAAPASSNGSIQPPSTQDSVATAIDPDLFDPDKSSSTSSTETSSAGSSSDHRQPSPNSPGRVSSSATTSTSSGSGSRRGSGRGSGSRQGSRQGSRCRCGRRCRCRCRCGRGGGGQGPEIPRINITNIVIAGAVSHFPFRRSRISILAEDLGMRVISDFQPASSSIPFHAMFPFTICGLAVLTCIRHQLRLSLHRHQ